MPVWVASPLAFAVASVVAGAIVTIGWFGAQPQFLSFDQLLLACGIIAIVMAPPVFVVRYKMGAAQVPSMGAKIGGSVGLVAGILFFGGMYGGFATQSRIWESVMASISLPLAGIAGGAVYCWLEESLTARVAN